ncbi:MAG TPA: hypothetical protein VGD98_09875 [Ktedonobacteraceae bacterium]
MRTRNCQGCGKPLVKPRRNQHYHNDRCKHAAYRARGDPDKPVALPVSSLPLVVLAGVDTLYVNAYYADPESFTRIERLLDDDLQTTLTDLQERSKFTGQNTETSWSLDKQPLHMLSHGSGKQWHWILKNDLINIQIGKGDYKGVIAHIRVSSEYLWRVNALHLVLGIVNGLANTLFAHETMLVPSAIDLCADVANWPMTAIDPLALVASARKRNHQFDDTSVSVPGKETWNGRKLGTLYVGIRTSPVHGKLYDKLKEIKDGANKKSWFHDLYKRNLWDGESPITRLEISFTREALHDLAIETVFDLMHNLKGLWGYAVGSETVKPWLRYTVPTSDHTQTRWPLHPTWATTVQHAFDSLDEEPARELIRYKKQRVNIDAATASLAGYLALRTMWQCEQDGMPVENMATRWALDDLYDAFQERWQKKGVTFQQLLQAKRHRYYLREEKTREVEQKRATIMATNDQDEPEAI